LVQQDPTVVAPTTIESARPGVPARPFDRAYRLQTAWSARSRPPEQGQRKVPRLAPMTTTTRPSTLMHSALQPGPATAHVLTRATGMAISAAPTTEAVAENPLTIRWRAVPPARRLRWRGGHTHPPQHLRTGQGFVDMPLGPWASNDSVAGAVEGTARLQSHAWASDRPRRPAGFGMRRRGRHARPLGKDCRMGGWGSGPDIEEAGNGDSRCGSGAERGKPAVGKTGFDRWMAPPGWQARRGHERPEARGIAANVVQCAPGCLRCSLHCSWRRLQLRVAVLVPDQLAGHQHRRGGQSDAGDP